MGHVCLDKVPGGYIPGGAVSYAATLARNLGYQTAILTSHGPDFKTTTYLPGIDCKVLPSTITTVFENKYKGGKRTQYLRQKAKNLTTGLLPETWKQADIALLGPVANEVSTGFLSAFKDSLICVCPQGWMRSWDSRGLVTQKQIDDWDKLTGAGIISISENDVGSDWGLINHIAAAVEILIVTLGAEGADVFHRGSKAHFPAFPTLEKDPTGAGDVFAAAFSIKFAECADIAHASAYASAAASLCVEKTGLAGVPNSDELESRYFDYAKMFGF